MPDPNKIASAEFERGFAKEGNELVIERIRFEHFLGDGTDKESESALLPRKQRDSTSLRQLRTGT
jgi:hypothetical protein